MRRRLVVLAAALAVSVPGSIAVAAASASASAPTCNRGSGASRKLEGGRHVPPRVSFFVEHNNPGDGPRPHRHRCDETSIIAGRVLARAGDGPFEGGPGDIAIAPAGIPHGSSTSAPQGPADLFNSGPAVQTECGWKLAALHVSFIGGTQGAPPIPGGGSRPGPGGAER
jgi:hypothetical protein